MRPRALTALVWMSVLVALVGFFLPWARIDARDAGLLAAMPSEGAVEGTVRQLAGDLRRVAVTIRRGTETITGELPTLGDLPRQVSGAQIPQLAGTHQAQLAVAVMELVSDHPQHLRLKSYAVYVLPGAALLCGVLLTWGARPMAAAVSLVCAGIAGVGGWKLLTMDIPTRVAEITIGEGLWMSLGAYAGLALAGGIGALVVGRTAK